MQWWVSAASVVVLWAGCADPADECNASTACDDGIACTVDTCSVEGICVHTASDAACATGETCMVAMGGCVAEAECEAATECDDAVDCTVDECSGSGQCVHTADDARCEEADNVCDPVDGCYTPCDSPAVCSDGIFCNGPEVCTEEQRCAPALGPASCDDTDPCTIDNGCDAEADACVMVCDAEAPGCECPEPIVTCTGVFVLDPAVNGSCAGGLVSYDLSTVSFESDGTSTSVTAASSTFAAMVDSIDPVCPSFDAALVLPGKCSETYTFAGEFSDDDHFDATFTVSYTGLCLDCTDAAFTVSGTRQ